MLDWLKKLLIEEEIEEIEEDKLEKIDFTKVDNIDNIVKETPKEEPRTVVEEQEDKKAEEPVVQIKKEFNIQLEPTVKKEVKPQVEVKVKKERTEKKGTENKEFELGSVISPMFGGGEIKKSETTVKPIKSNKKRDSLGTVISPMYGQEELFNHEIEALNKINETKVETIDVNDDDWKNDIPLEELISNEVEMNDCVQFSLFGDEKTVNE